MKKNSFGTKWVNNRLISLMILHKCQGHWNKNLSSQNDCFEEGSTNITV